MSALARSRGWLLALALAAACGPRAPPPDLSLDPAQLAAQVRAEQARVARVQGQARVHVASKAFTGSVSQFIAAEKPDRVHLEALDFFGNPAAVMVAGGGRFALYDARARVLYRGESTPENLALLVPLAVSAEDLVTFLCGSAPLLTGTPTRADPGDGVLKLLLDGGARTQAVDVGARAAVEASRVRDAAGNRIPGTPDATFDIFRTWGGARFPTEVKLSSEGPRVGVELAWREVEVNGAIDPALFRLEPPRGARVVDLRPGEPPPEVPPLGPPTPESHPSGQSRD